MSVFNQKCDGCGIKSPVVVDPDDECADVRAKMKAGKWVFKHGRSFCPDCMAKRINKADAEGEAK